MSGGQPGLVGNICLKIKYLVFKLFVSKTSQRKKADFLFEEIRQSNHLANIKAGRFFT
jgi:hypothetical protein